MFGRSSRQAVGVGGHHAVRLRERRAWTLLLVRLVTASILMPRRGPAPASTVEPAGLVRVSAGHLRVDRQAGDVTGPVPSAPRRAKGRPRTLPGHERWKRDGSGTALG